MINIPEADAEFVITGHDFIVRFAFPVDCGNVIDKATSSLGYKLRGARRLCGKLDPCTEMNFTFADGLSRQEITAGRIDLKRTICDYLSENHADQLKYDGHVRAAVRQPETSDADVDLEVFDVRVRDIVLVE